MFRQSRNCVIAIDLDRRTLDSNFCESYPRNMHDRNTGGAVYQMTTPPTNTEPDGKRYQAIKEHLFSQLNDEGVILSLSNGKYYGLNSVGVAVWISILEGATLAEIEAAVMREYDVDEDTCRREVASFLQEMLTEDLIETIDGASD